MFLIGVIIMARPVKFRKVCSMPERSFFGPAGFGPDGRNIVRMTIDEYETIRLIDLEGFTQEECATQMDVARTTVQGIYNDARKKLAEVIVEGATLFIDGGRYELCNEDAVSCGRGCRRNGKRSRNMDEKIVKIAVASDDEMVTNHFGHCKNFNIYHIENGKIVSNNSVFNPGHKPGFLPNFLKDLGVNVIIAGGMGGGAMELFNDNGIEVILGAEGNAREVVELYMKGELISSDSVCHEHAHHHDHDHEHNHDYGNCKN